MSAPVMARDTSSTFTGRELSIPLALIAVGIGAIGLSGWITDNEVLKRVHPALVSMKANTAIALMATGIATCLLSREPVSFWRRGLANLLAMAITALGFATLLQHLLHLDFGIDQWLFRESDEAAGQSFPGRMGVAASVNFTLLGLALLTIDLNPRGPARLASFFTLAPVVVTSLVFLYYFYGTEALAPISRYATIALHTVVGFFALCGAILAARPERGLMAVLLSSRPGSVMARRLWPAAVFCPIVLGWLVVLGQRAQWYGPGFGAALLVALLVIILSTIVWQTANVLDRFERERVERQREVVKQARLLDLSKDAIIVRDPADRITYWNHGAQEIYGYGSDQACGHISHDLLRTVFPQSRAEITRTLFHHGRWSGELIQTRSDGAPITVESQWALVRNPVTGAIESVMETNNDITARKRTEQALAQSERLLRLVTSGARVGLVVINSAYTYLFANESYLEIFGLQGRDLIGKRVPDVLPQGWTQIQPRLERAIRGERVEYELQLPGEVAPGEAAGSPRTISFIYEPHVDDAGARTVVVVVADITERARLWREISEAREMAERAVQAKDNFLAALSHELRTPLNPALLVASDAMHDPAIPPPFRSMFAEIARHISLEARLIDDLLDLTRISRGKLTLDIQRVDPAVALREAIAIVQADIRAKQIDFRTGLTSEACELAADTVRLQQVFWNVLKNAVKFTPEKGCVMVTSTVAREASTFVVEVRDTGIGLTAAELERVFQPFAQGDHAVGAGSHRFGGLGLGLAISHEIIRQHGGRLYATSAGRDRGALFCIELPLGAPVEAAVAGSSVPVIATKATTAARPLRILLVEDHAPTQQTLARLLRHRGHEATVAATGQDARHCAREQAFDLVVSDIGLPDVSGFDLMAELQAEHGLPGIALTGYGHDHDVNRSQAAGFFTHLTKPVRMETLEEALAAIAPVLPQRAPP